MSFTSHRNKALLMMPLTVTHFLSLLCLCIADVHIPTSAAMCNHSYHTRKRALNCEKFTGLRDQKNDVLWSQLQAQRVQRFLNEAPTSTRHFNPYMHLLPRTGKGILKEHTACRDAMVESPFECDTCAVVGSGPSLNDAEHGQFIDSHRVVFRINWLKTHTFEKKAGIRTSVNIFFATEGLLEQFGEHLALHSAPAAQKEPPPIALASPISELGLSSYMRYLDRLRFLSATNASSSAYLDQLRRKSQRPKDWRKITPPGVFFISDSVYHSALRHLCNATGNGCIWKKPTAGLIRPSTGFLAVVVALRVCRHVSLFGMSSPSATTNGTCRPFHYYDAPRQHQPVPESRAQDSECPSRNDERFHWFEAEHAIYREWHRQGLLRLYPYA